MNPARFMAGVKAAENHPAVEARIYDRHIREGNVTAADWVTRLRTIQKVTRAQHLWLKRGGFR